MRKTINIEYTTQVWKEANQFIAHAMPLDVVSSGETPQAAKQALEEAIELFLDTAMEMGTLEEILLEAGYTLDQEVWVSPSWVAIERHTTAIGI